MSYRKFRDLQKELAFAIERIWPPCERIDFIVADIDVWVTTDFCTARRLAPTWRRDVQLMVNELALPTPLRSWASGELSVQRLFKSFESVSALSYPAKPASKAFARVKYRVLPPTTVWVARLYGTWCRRQKGIHRCRCNSRFLFHTLLPAKAEHGSSIQLGHGEDGLKDV